MTHIHSTDIDGLAREIAAALGETTPEAQRQIAHALEHYGAEMIQSILAEALDIEREGGMPVPDGSRKRTLGGVFFLLLRKRTQPAGRVAKMPSQAIDAPVKLDETGGLARTPSSKGAEIAVSKLSDQIGGLAGEIAAALGETTSEARRQIARALECHGAELIQSLVTEALAIEHEGGLLLSDGSRKRSLGGVFFKLLHERTWQAGRSAAPPPEDGTPLKWENRMEAVQSALANPGAARVAKTTVVGRPEEVKSQNDFIVLAIPGDEDLPSLPRGVPRPPSTGTHFLVCIGGRQWPSIKQALQDPEDELVATGYAIPNIKQQTIVVFAGKVTTRVLQASSPRKKPAWK